MTWRASEQILAEIKTLEKWAKDYDTEQETGNTVLAAGAHDALHWALGLAEQSISETLERT